MDQRSFTPMNSSNIVSPKNLFAAQIQQNMFNQTAQSFFGRKGSQNLEDGGLRYKNQINLQNSNFKDNQTTHASSNFNGYTEKKSFQPFSSQNQTPNLFLQSQSLKISPRENQQKNNSQTFRYNQASDQKPNVQKFDINSQEDSQAGNRGFGLRKQSEGFKIHADGIKLKNNLLEPINQQSKYSTRNANSVLPNQKNIERIKTIQQPQLWNSNMINDQLVNSDQQAGRNLHSDLKDTQSQDFFAGSKQKTNPISVREFVQVGMRNTFNLTQPKFGLKSYEIQDSQLKDKIYKIENFGNRKSDKADRFTDLAIKLTKNFPPAHYDVTKDWAKPEMFATTQGKHRGCFLKAPRITSSEAAMKFAIKRGVPAPTAYKTQEFIGQGVKAREASGDKFEKICGFIEQAKWEGMKTPGAKYDKNYIITDLNPRTARIWKEGEYDKKQARIIKIGKDKSVSPDTYQTAKSFDDTQICHSMFKLGKANLVNFTDSYKKIKAFVPGPGTHKFEVEKVYNFMSNSPRSISVKRH